MKQRTTHEVINKDQATIFDSLSKSDPIEIGDKALCEVIKMDYSKFKKLDYKTKYELSNKYLNETLDIIIKYYRNKYELDEFEELKDFLSSYSYSFKFTPSILRDSGCYEAVCNRFMDLNYYKLASDESSSGNDKYKLNLQNPSERFSRYNSFTELNNVAYDRASSFLNDYFLKKDMIRICPGLFRELINTLSIFKKDYDLSKSKVREVVRSIISFQISLYNSNVYSARNGMFDSVVDKHGNLNKKVSSNEYYKLRLNQEIIKAIKTLDEMIEGNKNVNVNMDVKSISIDDILKKIDI